MRKFITLVVVLLILLGSAFFFDRIDLSQREGVFELPSQKESQVIQQEKALIQLVEEALPSVITIRTTHTPPSDFFDLFEVEDEKSREVNIGSGFVVAENGLIITNKHVVADSEADYRVLTNNNREYPVQKIYRDPLNDLAILQIDARLDPLPLGDSSQLQLGQTVVAIGTPLDEFTNTVTAGIISGLGRGVEAGNPFEGFVEQLDNVIQTDAAINPGNSGGPLLDSSGNVVGVNTALAARGQNIGFALPSGIVRELLTTFQEQGGTFERPFLGIRYRMIDKETAQGNDTVAGAYLIEVVLDSPAQRAGLRQGNIITQIEGENLGQEESLIQALQEKEVGDTVMLRVWRNDTTEEVTLELGKTTR